MDASVLLYLIDYQSTCGRSAGIFFSSLKQLRTAQWNALFDMAISYQVFGYLDRVQCRSFTDLVADTPEGQSVRVGNILADTAHIDRIAAGQQQRHRIFLLVGFIHQHDSLGTAKCFAGLFDRYGTLRFEPYRLGVRTHHRYPDTGRHSLRYRSA